MHELLAHEVRGEALHGPAKLAYHRACAHRTGHAAFNQPSQPFDVTLKLWAAFGMSEKGPEAAYVEVEHGLLEKYAGRRIGTLDQQVGAECQTQGAELRIVKAGQPGQRDLGSGVDGEWDLLPFKGGAQHRNPFGDLLALDAVLEVDVWGHDHRMDAFVDGCLSHLKAGFDVEGPVIDRREQVAVQIYHPPGR